MTHLLSIPVTDAKGSVDRVAIFIPDAATLPEITAFYSTVATALDAVTEGVVGNGTVEFGLTAPGGLKGAAAANSDIQEGGLLTFNTDARYKFGLRVPAWLQSAFAGKNITLNDSGVVDAFVALISTGDGTITPVDPQGAAITGISKGIKSFRRK